MMPDKQGNKTLRDMFPLYCTICNGIIKPTRWSDGEPPAAGRPATLDDGQAVTVYLPAAMAERAAELGDGNVSAGVRIALQQALS